MRKALLNVYRCIVGPECGFTGEGNAQWYYTLAVAINLMLIWTLKPEVALTFTILAVIHYATVVIYGIRLEDYGASVSCVYLGIHLILLIIAICTSFEWTMKMTVIIIGALLLAPDCTGNNVFLRKIRPNTKLPLLFNMLIFIAFLVIDILIPVKLWVKLVLIAIALVLHPIIDILEGECIDIVDSIDEAIRNIIE